MMNLNVFRYYYYHHHIIIIIINIVIIPASTSSPPSSFYIILIPIIIITVVIIFSTNTDLIDLLRLNIVCRDSQSDQITSPSVKTKETVKGLQTVLKFLCVSVRVSYANCVFLCMREDTHKHKHKRGKREKGKHKKRVDESCVCEILF